MMKFRTIHCQIDNRRLFETDSKNGVIEIKCMKCKNIVRIDLMTDEQVIKTHGAGIATSK